MNAEASPIADAKSRATYRDVLNAPPDMVAELLEGKLYTQARPTFPHMWAASSLFGIIREEFGFRRGGSGVWWIAPEPQLHFGRDGNDVIVPDIAGWRRQNMLIMPEASRIDVASDWVCEVLSRSTKQVDRNPKCRIYAREDVSHLWFVDPIAKTLEAFELREGSWFSLALLSGDAQVSLPPFEGFSFPLGDLWLSSANEASLAERGGIQ